MNILDSDRFIVLCYLCFVTVAFSCYYLVLLSIAILCCQLCDYSASEESTRHFFIYIQV
jgi:hypothetical protein